MSNFKNQRKGGTVGIEDVDDIPLTALHLNDEQALSVTYLKFDYHPSATEDTTVVVYDEFHGADEGELERDVEAVHLEPGDTVIIEEGVYDNFERDVTVLPDGEQDSHIQVTVGGYVVAG